VNCWQDLLEIRLHSRTLLGVVALVGIMFQTEGVIGQVAPHTRLSTRSTEASKGTAHDSAAQDGKPVLCPVFSSPAMQSQLQGGHHKVILSWKTAASTRSDDKDPVQGYCVYRKIKQNDAPLELINSIPFTGTTCTDDLVADDEVYYYVVMAISAKGRTSSFSNEATAGIPGKKQPSVSVGSYPLCRKAARSK
jgi:hypothetical protein